MILGTALKFAGSKSDAPASLRPRRCNFVTLWTASGALLETQLHGDNIGQTLGYAASPAIRPSNLQGRRKLTDMVFAPTSQQMEEEQTAKLEASLEGCLCLPVASLGRKPSVSDGRIFTSQERQERKEEKGPHHTTSSGKGPFLGRWSAVCSVGQIGCLSTLPVRGA
jgi:hypothetical protein